MTDWGGLVDKGLDGIEHGVDSAKKVIGHGVDRATDEVGGFLDRVGAHGWEDKVEDFGDSAASRLGASVREQELGETEQADELIHGRPSAIRSSSQHFSDFRAAFDRVGQGMKALDSDRWKGQAAVAFRAKFAMHPTDWLRASDACESASSALGRYAETVEWAQKQAEEAIELHKAAVNASKEAHDAHVAKEDAYRTAAKAGRDPGPIPVEGADPGLAGRKRAKEILEEARRQRDEAATTAERALRSAMEHAPAEPPATDRLLAEIVDYAGSEAFELSHVVGGVAKGTAGTLNFARGLNPFDPYNLTHPADFQQNVNMTLADLVSTASQPDRIPGPLIDSYMADPSEFKGRLLPDLLGTKGFGGARAGMRFAEDAAESAARREAARAATKAEAEAAARRKADLECKGDPVDVATGRMVLPQTDLVLPGSLPLVFTRTFESSFRAGRWFGPSWASTVDQRLEIDEEGLILVREDGSLLAYPHPEPGATALPGHGQRWPLTLDTDGGYTVTDPESGLVRHFTDEGLLTQLDDRNGAWIAFTYDKWGTPTALSHSGGYEVRVTSSEGRITGLALTDGTEVLRYGYTDGHLSHVTNSSNSPLRFGYDELGRITSWTDTNGRHFDYVYDDRHRCVAQSGINGHLRVRFAYGDGSTTYANSLGHETRYLVDDRARITAEIDPTGATTRFTHDAYNRLLTRTDPLGHTTRCVYDEQGRLTTLVRPDGREVRAEYDELGLPITVIQPDGRVTHATYDERGNRTSATAPFGGVNRFTYDTRGHLASVTDALGAATTVRCDPAGLILEITDPLGATTRFTRDAFGRPIAITDPLGHTTRLTWSVEGRLLHRVNADGGTESWTYDGEGNCTSHTDPVGGVTASEYGEFDLLTAHTGPDGVRYSFAHDTELRLTEVTNPQGLTWTYAYDAAGRLACETDFDDRTLTYRYDAAGRLASRTNALGATTTYTHDSLSHLLSKTTADGVTSYAYDVFGELARAVSPDGTTLTLRRDRFGRVASETVDGRTLSYTYDGAGRRAGRITPSGSASEWTYDAAGQRRTLIASGRTLTFERDAAGRELTRTIGTGLDLVQTYDPLGRLTDQHLVGQDGRTLQRRGYCYRADGSLTAIDDALAGLRTFTLDAAARVTAVDAANWSERYAYDDAGNQTSASWPTRHPGAEAQGERAYTGTRITSAGSIRYEHDALGRVVLRQKTRLSRKPDTWRYKWDAEDRLVGVTAPDGTRWRYAYDALSRRTAKQRLTPTGEVAEEVLFTWDGTTLCEQTEGLATLTWTHHGLHPLTQAESILGTTDDRFFAIVTDLIGTPRELIDESGEIAWRARSTLWGSTTWTRDSTAYTPLRFPGQYFDPESGLHHNYFRTYDPETARYLTPDPLGLTPAPNPATYVSNPHTWSDPLGLTPCPELGLSDAAQRAIEKLENIKVDPVGEINSQPNHNHYDAARREAGGEVVARKKDGTPFDHIADLTQARNGLDHVRRTLEREISNLPDSITDRGLEVLIDKRKETIQILDRLNGFLHSIGRR
ncbi:putative T7SS-secreted protein [Streptomyces sp. 3211]|uniref:putative T7SS-secreted protein n=1 Tax=Streptomyces sp. 3211 TaxID=1964449 RepID=UPI0009A476C1|nr:polymorphic toxin type 28 domain-containing protein [Streptomyces sp. 3211]